MMDYKTWSAVNFTMPTIGEIFNFAIDTLIYILSIIGSLSIVAIGSLLGVCIIITLINVVLSITLKAIRRIRNVK